LGLETGWVGGGAIQSFKRTSLSVFLEFSVARAARFAAPDYALIALILRYLQTRTPNIFIYYRTAFGIVISLLVVLHVGYAR
jgi:undecaprenyl pyrophosphate phosphatase UppP